MLRAAVGCAEHIDGKGPRTMAMTDTAGSTGEPIQKRSGWLLPLAVFVVTGALSAVVLYYYLGPRPPGFVRDVPSPTADTTVVALSVNGVSFSIPANHIVYRGAQHGGEQADVALFALLPNFRGFSPADAQRFASNAPDSGAIFLLIRGDRLNLTESERLKRIYLGYVDNQMGVPGPYGLTQYDFRGDSGYRGEDLFVGQTAHGPAVFRCVRFSVDAPSPSCLRETPLTQGVAVSYRFKRAHLSQWREIGAGTDALVQSFLKRKS
jgi:hypothetical protein